MPVEVGGLAAVGELHAEAQELVGHRVVFEGAVVEQVGKLPMSVRWGPVMSAVNGTAVAQPVRATRSATVSLTPTLTVP
jgi:hypothetical protein